MLNSDLISKLLGKSVSEFHLLEGGRNNEVASFLVDEMKLVCKQFSQEDKVKRFQREIAFLHYCSTINLSNTPKLISYYPEQSIIFLGFVDGLRIEQVSWSFIETFCDFLEHLNFSNFSNEAKKLPFAADALLGKHTLSRDIRKRIKNLNEIDSIEIGMLVQKLKEIYLSICNVKPLQGRLTDVYRYSSLAQTIIVSPSDVGIHNYIVTSNGPIFIDFEYAGLDSSIKLFFDLWAHPDLRLSEDHMRFIHSTLRGIFRFELESIDREILRIFAIKWSLIMLKNIESIKEVPKVIDYAGRHGLDIG